MTKMFKSNVDLHNEKCHNKHTNLPKIAVFWIYQHVVWEIGINVSEQPAVSMFM